MYDPCMRFWYFHVHAQIPLINARTDVSSKARGLVFDLSLHLHPIFMFAGRFCAYAQTHTNHRFILMRCPKYHALGHYNWASSRQNLFRVSDKVTFKRVS